MKTTNMKVETVSGITIIPAYRTPETHSITDDLVFATEKKLIRTDLDAMKQVFFCEKHNYDNTDCIYGKQEGEDYLIILPYSVK